MEETSEEVKRLDFAIFNPPNDKMIKFHSMIYISSRLFIRNWQTIGRNTIEKEKESFRHHWSKDQNTEHISN